MKKRTIFTPMLSFFKESQKETTYLEKNVDQNAKVAIKSQHRRVNRVETREYFEKMLTEMEERLKKVNIDLGECPEGSLVQHNRGQAITYFHVYEENGRRKRKGITKERELGENLFRPQPDSWASEPYKQSDYKPEMKRFTTSRFLKVRSKSELLIVEKLYEHDIDLRYEQVIAFENKEFAPDFTIRRKSDGKIFYWEHCGRTSDKGYNKHNRWKLSQYERMGIVPWDNLIVTYDSEDGILNIPLIESEIINKLKR